MAVINLVLQGKGGVGKSYVASLLTQYNRLRERKLICIDTDPVNASYSAYEAYDVKRLELLSDDQNIDQRAFDDLIESFLKAKKDDQIIVDNGAASFVPLCAYLVENDVMNFLTSQGHDVRLHSVLTGGQGMNDTLVGLKGLFANFSAPVVVWLNEYFGLIRQNGKGFEDSTLYSEHEDRMLALVRIPRLSSATFQVDIEQMLNNHLTYEEAIASKSFKVMAKQRLRLTWNGLQAEMEKAGL